MISDEQFYPNQYTVGEQHLEQPIPAVALPATVQRAAPAIPVTVRHAEPEDYMALHHIFADPQVMYWTSAMPFTPLARLRRQLTDPSEGHYGLVACIGEAVVGTLACIVLPIPRARHTGHLSLLAVAPAWQRRGVGAALMQAVIDLADNWLNLARLELMVFSDNGRAINLYRAFGFVTEGTHRRYAFRAGRYADMDTMARIREI